jgi:hypothetical protein
VTPRSGSARPASGSTQARRVQHRHPRTDRASWSTSGRRTRRAGSCTDSRQEQVRDRWYENQRRGLGLTFLAAVDRAVESITRWPRAGSFVEFVSDDLEVRGDGSTVPVLRCLPHLRPTHRRARRRA